MRTIFSLAVLLPVATIGCGSNRSGSPISDGGHDAPAEDAAGSPGAITAMTGSVQTFCDLGQPLSSCESQVEVTVFGVALTPIDDATVTVNGTDVPSVGGGRYVTTGAGLDATYTFVARRGDDELSRTRAAPSDFTISLSPDPPVAGMPAEITWDVTAEPDVVAQVTVQGASDMLNATGEPDDGSFTVPASAFPTPGTYRATVARAAFTTGPETGSATTLVLTRTATVAVE